MSSEPSTRNTQTGTGHLNRIRVETALSRFPIHRLAKKGSIAIDLQRLTEEGEADFKWEVTYNVKHGQPGPLAYKVDTLIVNRCIDELGRPLPEVIQIGSLSDICRALGSCDTGPNIADIKRAFLQNASAFINAKILYKTKTGRARWGEIGYTRYSVIFTGETLPDGREADAVYIVLNPPYRDLLNHVEVRPLDYDYLRQLAPGPQRFYELLSFQVYGALASGRPRAKMSYAEYCQHAPQMRYLDFDHVKKQMYKVHLPHRDSGYILKVDYQETTDGKGQPDWEMFYTPGPKAMAEYEAFTNRQIRHQQPIVSSAPSNHAAVPVQASLELMDEPAAPLLDALMRRGVTEKKARDLLAALKPGQEVIDQLEYVDHVLAQAPKGKFRNPSGFYVKFIENNGPVPDSFWSSRRRQQHVAAQQTKESERSRLFRLQQAYDEHVRQAVQAFIHEQLRVEEFEAMVAPRRLDAKRTFRSMTDAQIDEIARGMASASLKDSGRVPLLSFDEFCRKTPLSD